MKFSNPTSDVRSRARAGAAVLAAAALLLAFAPSAVAQKQGHKNKGMQGPPPAAATVVHANVGPKDVRRIAKANGYNQGFDHGTVDRQRGAHGGYANGREYQRGVTGYHNDFHSPFEYHNFYQSGYAIGYNDAYNRRHRDLVFDYRTLYRMYPWYRNVYYENPWYRYNNPNQWVPTYYNDGGYGDFYYDDDHHGRMDPEWVARQAAERGYYAGYERGAYDASRDRGRPNPNPQGHGAYQFALDGWVPDWGYGATYQRVYRYYFIHGSEDAYRQRGRAFAYRPI